MKATHGQATLLNIAMFVGIAVGSPFIGHLADQFGRKSALLYATTWLTYFGLLR